MNKNVRIRKSSLILILGALTTIGPFSVDMYLPAFSQIALDLHTTTARVALSLSSYFVGLSIGQLFYGPLLDRFGRKKPIYVGLLLYVLASIGCLSSGSIEALVAFRFLQALGGCAAQVASMAMVRDFFPVEEGAKVLSILMLILGVSPLFAPTVGGFLVSYWRWRGIFYILTGIVLITLGIVRLYLPQGHKPDPTVSLRLKPIFDRFGKILQEPQFFIYSMAGAFSFAGLFVYVAGSPLLFLEVFQVSASRYGAIFALLSVGFIGGSQVNLLLSRRYSSAAIFRGALIVQSVMGLLFVFGASQSLMGLHATVAFLFVYLSCAGITSPNATILALAPFPNQAGSASALIGFLQMGVGALASAGVGLVSSHSALGVILLLSLPAWTGLLILTLLGQRWKLLKK